MATEVAGVILTQKPFSGQNFVTVLRTPRCCWLEQEGLDVNFVGLDLLGTLRLSDVHYRVVKNIILTGFGHITLLDLDTIDLSNLNRQFLFKKKDVKQSKAMVSTIYPGYCPASFH
jgi:hypothetical protein